MAFLEHKLTTEAQAIGIHSCSFSRARHRRTRHRRAPLKLRHQPHPVARKTLVLVTAQATTLWEILVQLLRRQLVKRVMPSTQTRLRRSSERSSTGKTLISRLILKGVPLLADKQ